MVSGRGRERDHIIVRMWQREAGLLGGTVSLVSTSFVAGTQQQEQVRPAGRGRDQPPSPTQDPNPSSSLSCRPPVNAPGAWKSCCVRTCVTTQPAAQPERAGRGRGGVLCACNCVVLQRAVTVRGRSSTGALCACRDRWLVPLTSAQLDRRYVPGVRVHGQGFTADTTVRFDRFAVVDRSAPIVSNSSLRRARAAKREPRRPVAA